MYQQQPTLCLLQGRKEEIMYHMNFFYQSIPRYFHCLQGSYGAISIDNLIGKVIDLNLNVHARHMLLRLQRSRNEYLYLSFLYVFLLFHLLLINQFFEKLHLRLLKKTRFTVYDFYVSIIII